MRFKLFYLLCWVEILARLFILAEGIEFTLLLSLPLKLFLQAFLSFTFLLLPSWLFSHLLITFPFWYFLFFLEFRFFYFHPLSWWLICPLFFLIYTFCQKFLFHRWRRGDLRILSFFIF